MSLFTKLPEDAIFMNREDAFDPLASFSHHDFELDGLTWPSVEHYFQGMKFQDDGLRRKISLARDPSVARKMARWNFWKIRKDWKKIRNVVMTRATYIKCKTHEEVRDALLATGERMIVESSLYDHYWGCGRDQRGHNYYGKMLVEVRSRLRSESPG